ncbi:hypothetical protein [Acinetobacter sp. Marseille-Q1623]|uniref:hypothetical protein n=1 Tax=Acinetobacter sp. Marseille-Q1623 TaxID=2697501 RepID=UPI00157A33C2|nr:hypothetical protein [Acinetobacter sp. Marseille-Q1623]
MQRTGLDRKSRNYLDSLHINFTYREEQFIAISALIKANIAFKEKLEKFKKFIDCLSADRCFALWTRETEELLLQSENALTRYNNEEMSEALLVEIHKNLAEKIQELADCRLYEGHWEYGLSEEVDQQFDDLTELCRRIWLKENKACLSLAKTWGRLKLS